MQMILYASEKRLKSTLIYINSTLKVKINNEMIINSKKS